MDYSQLFIGSTHPTGPEVAPVMVISVCASARRTAGAAGEGASRMRAPVAGVKGTHDCRVGQASWHMCQWP